MPVPENWADIPKRLALPKMSVEFEESAASEADDGSPSAARATKLVQKVIVVSPLSVLGAWGSTLILEAARLCKPPLDLRIVDSNATIDGLASSSDCGTQLIQTHFPGRGLITSSWLADAPAVAFVDIAADSVRYSMATMAVPFLETMRSQTAAATLIAEFARSRPTLVVNRVPSRDAHDTVRAILDHLHWPLAQTAVDHLLRLFGAERPGEATLEEALARSVPEYRALDLLSHGFEEEQLEAVEQSLAPLLQMASTGGGRPPLVWPRAVFLSGDNHKPLPPIAEVVGHSRAIFYGPYFHVPVGSWTVNVVVAFSDDIHAMPFVLEAVAVGKVLGSASLKPDSGGVFSVTFSFTVSQPQYPVELRMINVEGAIEGHTALAKVELWPDQEDA